MKSQTLLKLGLFLIFALAGFLFASPAKAAAASYCAVLAPAYTASNCLAGQDYSTCTVVNGSYPNCGSGASSDQLKNQFVNNMKGFESGQHFQQVGARTMEDTLSGGLGANAKDPANGEYVWINNIMAGNTKLSIDSSFSSCKNTAYDPSQDADISVPECVSNVVVLRLSFDNGGVVLYIKLNCGNFLGDITPVKQSALIGQFKALQCPAALVSGKDGVVVAATDTSDGQTNGSDGYAVTVRVEWSGNIILGPALANDTVSGYQNHNNHQFNGSDWSNFVLAHANDNNPVKTLVLWGQDNQTGEWQKLDAQDFDTSKCVSATAPYGQITAKCNTDGSGNATVTVVAFGDRDGTTTAKAYINGTVQSPNPLTTAGVSWTVPAATATTTGVAARLDVKDVNYDGSNNGYKTVSSSKVTCNTGSTGDCQGQNLKPAVTLPAGNLPTHSGTTVGTTAPAYSTTGTGAKYTTTKSAKYYQEDPGDYRVTKAQDQYSPSPTGISTTAGMPTAYQSSSTFTLDYGNYFTQYPYDDHLTTVTYNQRFNETYWYTNGSPDFYTCPAGMTNNNNGTCTYDAKATIPVTTYPATNCVNGGSGFDGTYCWAYAHPYNVGSPPSACSAGSVKHNGACYVPYNPCAAGDTLSGSTCTHTGTTTYSCNPGDGNPDSNHKCKTTAEYDYYWHTNATVSNVAGPDTTYSNSATQPTANSTFLKECYYRDFDVQPPNLTDITSVTLNPNTENPTSTTIGTLTTVAFTLTQGPVTALRHGMGVSGLNYTAQYYIEHANGAAPTPLAGLPTSLSLPEIGGGVMNSGGTANYSYNPSTAVSVPPMAVGDEVCAQFSITSESGTVNENGAIVTQDGQSQDSTRIAANPYKTCSAPVSNTPYGRFYGNDVLAGAQFPNGSCNGASIDGYRNGAAGSGSQFAAMSIGQIQNFASAFLRTSAPVPPTGLSFANTTGGDGGNFKSSCVTTLPDYWTTDQPSNTTSTTLGAITSPTTAGNYPYTTPGGQLNSLSLPDGASVVIFVDGDVTINGNITYSNAGNLGSWSWDNTNRVSNIPSFYIIAKGDINIAPTVSRLDGVYIAQGASRTGGTIRTCSPSTGIDPTTLYNDCNFQLTVNGAFVAKDVRLNRTYKSLRDGAANESPFGGTQNAGEIFNFSPELYLNNPAINATSGPSIDKYDFITSLSPVL